MELYKITDIDQMADGLREFCFNNFDLGTPPPELGYDGYVTIPQIKHMILSAAKFEDGGLYITDEGITVVSLAISRRVKTTALARIAAAGLVEVGFDGKEFIFWKPEGDGDAIGTVA